MCFPHLSNYVFFPVGRGIQFSDSELKKESATHDEI